MKVSNIFLAFLIFYNAVSVENKRYEPKWESLDSRPLPQWYDDAKLGIFIHWGVYSVPSFGSEWFWAHWKIGGNWDYVKFMEDNYAPGFTYQEFAKDFKAEFYNPDEWADLFQKSGAKYIVLTSKHHEGYTLWPSTYSFSWNSVDVGSHRDLVGELANSIRHKTDLKFGLYHSLLEWFNPVYMEDKNNNFVNSTFTLKKVIPELKEIVNKYKPEIVWTDGEWEAPSEYWKAKDFLAWLYNESPVKDTVVANDRWGNDDILCKHGDIHTCHDRFNPGVLQSHKWENAMTIDRYSWGYRRNTRIEDFFSTHELLETLAQTVSCGGNLLMNVGPSADGRIVPIFQERLLEMGEWLSINGEAIYSSRPWIHQNEDDKKVWYTAKDGFVYAIIFYWPDGNLMYLQKVKDLFESKNTTVTLLGNPETLQWTATEKEIRFQFPDKATVKSRWVYVLKIEDTTYGK